MILANLYWLRKMPAVARSSSVDSVSSPDGTGNKCSLPTTQSTDEGVSKVYVQSKLAIHIGNKMIEHPGNNNCALHSPPLKTASAKVFCEGSGIARVGDIYGSEDIPDHIILTGSSKVFSG